MHECIKVIKLNKTQGFYLAAGATVIQVNLINLIDMKGSISRMPSSTWAKVNFLPYNNVPNIEKKTWKYGWKVTNLYWIRVTILDGV